MTGNIGTKTGNLLKITQNRFDRIWVKEDTCLLELVRYIPLNPIRAGKELFMLPGVEGVRYPPYSVGKKTGIKQREYKCFR